MTMSENLLAVDDQQFGFKRSLGFITNTIHLRLFPALHSKVLLGFITPLVKRPLFKIRLNSV
jgi:hypothetical protein